MASHRVLIVNKALTARGGTQTHVRDLAHGLRRRGHQPIVFSGETGEFADALRRETIAVTADLSTIGAQPTVIHGNSSLETMAALHQFPSVPAIFVCHGWWSWYAAPPQFPRIRRYVAVDDTCLERMLFREGIPEARSSVILNAVDLDRFGRRDPLPQTPARAAVFSNFANELTHVEVVRKACQQRGISLDVIGWSSGNATEAPEALLHRYDLVFAKAKCALEALAVGCSVILCDATGAGPMVTVANWQALRRVNFGVRALDCDLAEEHLLQEMSRYDPADAARVTAAVREHSSVDDAVDSFIALYDEAVAEHQIESYDAAEEGIATSRYLQSLSIHLSERSDGETLFPLLQLANRLLRTPVLGPVLRWTASHAVRTTGRGGSRGEGS